MFKKTKMALMSLLCVGCCAAAGAGAVSYGVNASAETTVFKVDGGAAVRLQAEDSEFGIRFAATVGEVVEGAKYNMLILPVELVDYYNADTTEGKADIVTYMKALAAENGGTLSIVEDCIVRTDGKIYGSIVDVLWNNINRDFVAVAYYEKDGAITVAQMADDGERSVVDVSNNALESGDYDGSDETSVANKSILIDKVRQGEKQAAGHASEDSYIYEDFRYATNDSHIQIAYGIADTWSFPCIVKNGEDYALQFKRVNDAWGLLTLNFGTVKAGNYKLSFKMTENAIGTLINAANPEKGAIDYNNWKLMGWDGDSYDVDYGYLFQKYYVGNDTFEFYFNQAEDGELKFGIAGLDANATFAGQGQILLDDMCLEPVAEIPTVTKKLNVFTSANFDDMVSPFIPLENYGIYTLNNMTPTVNMSENNSLTVNSSAYGLVAMYLGDLTPGQYKLKLNATMADGFPAVLGGATMTMAEDGTVSVASHIYFDYVGKNLSAERVNTLAEYYPNSDGSYELIFTVNASMTNFCLYFANNVEAASSMTLDAISFEKMTIDYTKGYTFDFEDGVSFNFANTTGAGAIDFLGFVGVSALLRTNETTNAIEIQDNVTINGQTSRALAVNINLGWKTYFAIDLGYLESGTYTIEVDLMATSDGYSRGVFAYVANGTATDFTTAYTGEGRYTFTFTLTEAAEVFFRYREPNTNVNKSTAYMDNLTITKTA